MRIGVLTELSPAARYRVHYPLDAMQRRGHDIVWPNDDGSPRVDAFPSCDALLVYRSHGSAVRNLLKRLRASGIAIVWDNDDDLRHLPRDRATRRRAGGFSNQAIFDETARTAKLAHVAIATSEPIAAAYRGAGVRDVRVIANYLASGTARQARPHDGVVVGWIAGLEHASDVQPLRLNETFRALQVEHPDLNVITIGVRLALRERYRHAPHVVFDKLPAVMAGFDIGLAPLLDTPFNRARSDIKIKEYAASGVPWLASPVGPYAELGEDAGGRLVPVGSWHEVLNKLIGDANARRHLAQTGRDWARGQTIDAVVDRYETAFADAVGRVGEAAFASA
ncbi:glycosyltransferase [Baekduia alba]|uniref:hypothetical protein n=1 Tax=Baekduia alba TaxID=2997333 RepID=UPI0023426779|nr:hypothetical protein [Baekduia alba]WCB95749.1 glycosyltransferase [Baekduia alba]